jgi:hypothetical protein
MNQATKHKTPWSDGSGPFSIEQVLTDEAWELHGENNETKELEKLAKDQRDLDERERLNADDRGALDLNSKDTEPHDKFYTELNKLNRAALCCSGGGIRSATFCLGVIQAFANYDVAAGKLRGKAAAIAHGSEQPGTAAPAQQADDGSKSDTHENIKPETSALRYFHYLSTVSGGGYVGSWLSSWRSRSSFDTIVKNLTRRPYGADIEPPEISWLRAYSNYLTPQLGITSADGWAAGAILIRNLILNWLVIIPILCVALLLMKLIATGGTWFAHTVRDERVLWLATAGAVFLVITQSFTNSHRPPRRTEEVGPDPGLYFWVALVCAFLSAVCFTTFFSSRWFLECFADRVGGASAWLTAALGSLHIGFGWVPDWVSLDLKAKFFLLTAIAGALIYAAGWFAGLIAGRVVCLIFGPISMSQFTRGLVDWLRWAASGLVYGGMVGLGVYLLWRLGPYPATPRNVRCLLIAAILGVPWIMMSQLVAEIVFSGLSSDETRADADREWLGRAAGWLATLTVTWAILAFLVLAGGYIVEDAVDLGHQTLVKAGGIVGVLSAIVTAALGGSAKTPAKSSSDDQGSVSAIAYNIALGLAGPLFVAVLIIVLSAGLDNLLIGDALVRKMQLIGDEINPASTGTMLAWLGIGLAVAAVVGLLASICVNINRFSLHALYRNRLTRCYLGASNDKRNPDRFSGFDFHDNLCVHQVWPPLPGKGENPLSLFHVVNIALNVVSTKRLAWQERKAESFTVSPLHCGAAYLGFRASEDYGGQSEGRAEAKAAEAEAEAEAAKAEAEAAKAEAEAEAAKAKVKAAQAKVKAKAAKAEAEAKAKAAEAAKVDSGLSLGTAMAISGAAVSPNMGYHSSPSMALLLTLLNVRLGWWLGNPGGAGENTYKEEGPKLAAGPLLVEALGKTTDQSRYVYLSDGGHFENLGLYEMVRRRCRLIVLIDAGCDADFAFEDLGNAVRKIYIDLGVRITFDKLGELKNRPSPKSLSRAMRDAAAHARVQAVQKPEGEPPKPPGKPPYHAVGVIHYKEADRISAKDPEHKGADDGYILYIKPAYHGSEKNAGVRSYAIANPTFPHEATADQWFTESQLESYRSLGLEIAAYILHRAGDVVLGDDETGKNKLTLQKALHDLKVEQDKTAAPATAPATKA